MEQDIKIRAVRYEEDGMHYIQLLDKDMLVYGKTEGELLQSFQAAISVYLHVKRRNNQAPFQDEPKAPEKYLKAFESDANPEVVSFDLVPVWDLKKDADSMTSTLQAIVSKKAA